MSISTKHIGYLERNYLEQLPDEIDDAETSVPDQAGTQFLRVQGILRFWEQNESKVVATRRYLADIAAGMHGARMPLIYLIISETDEIRLYIGTYCDRDSNEDKESNGKINLEAISTIFKSAYPGMDLKEEEKGRIYKFLEPFEYTAMMIGTPTVKVGTGEIGTEQIERIIRGLYGRSWAYAVFATPAEEQEILKLYNITLNEMLTITNEALSTSIQSPVAEKYQALLDTYLSKLVTGKTLGMWHTAIYFMSPDIITFNQGKAILRSVFGGAESKPDPIRLVNCHNINSQIRNFARIITPGPEPPGGIRYPYKYMNTLDSVELASVSHLPTEEMPGYFIKDYARFDVASHCSGDAASVKIGEILSEGRPTGCQYEVNIQSLDRHGLIAGTTGSGKTNTIFYLLKQIWQRNIPFMVIEPAKTEYRKLLQSEEIGKDLQIFTLGDDMTSPFRLNPFEIMDGVSVQAHIDRLKSVFNASFILYAPMPYVLERCIHEVYEDKGWNLVTNENERGFHRNAQPTLTDLYRKVDEVTDRLGYESKLTMDIKASLKTRINSLRIGGKGLMLDTRKSIPIEKLLRKPTILEIEQIGDDDEKAFVIGLLLTSLYEHYVSEGLKEGKGLSHVTIVEEAHRLLKNVPSVLDTEAANTKGKAVETFCNILSEIRAYGEGFIVAEQIPSKLSSDLIKNTNLKVMHRIVSEEDRVIMGGTMNLNGEEERYVASLENGKAAVFGEGDDSSILVKVPFAKIETPELDKTEENYMIRETMKGFAGEIADVYKPLADYSVFSDSIQEYAKEAERIIEDPEFREILARYIISSAVQDSALIDEFQNLAQYINGLRRSRSPDAGIIACTLLYGVDNYFESLGQQYGLKYSDVDSLKKDFLAVLSPIVLQRYTSSSIESKLTIEERNDIKAFQKKYKVTFRCPFYPFLGCEKVCIDNTCLYRYNIQPLLADGRLDQNFVKTLKESSGTDMWKELGETCQIAMRRTIADSAPSEEKKRAGICFAIQKSGAMPYLDMFLREKVVTSMINLFKEIEI